MKLIIKRIVACIVFLSILIFAFFKIDEVLEVKDSNIKYDQFFNSETNFDVIFMGTSHAYHSIYTQELWKNYGITSYNYGFSHGTLVENYYALREAIKYTSPKLVVVDLYGLMEYEDRGNGKYISGRIEQRHTMFDALPLTLDKIDAVRDIYDDYEDNYDFIFKFAMYHNRWDELTEKDFNYTASVEKGSDILYGHKTEEYTKVEEYEKVEINSVCASYIPKMVDLCSENDIELLFVYLPFAASERYQNVAHACEEYLKQFDCKYINMLDLGILNQTTDAYVDGTHLNHMGGYKTTVWLGNYLRENYDLPDYRNDKEYKSWNTDYEEYVDFKVSKFYKQPKYSSLIQNLLLAYGDDFTLELQIKGKNKKIKKDETLQAIFETYKTEFSDNFTIEEIDQPMYNGKKCDLVLTIKRNSTGEVVLNKGYKIR